MAERILKLNNFQQSVILANARDTTVLAGRGAGKSFLAGWIIDRIVKTMPRSIIGITAKTYGQAMTRTLPATFKALEQLGYYNGYQYVANKMPPKNFQKPYETVFKYENFFSILNGTGLMLFTQDGKGSSRGPSLDFELIDEALTVDKVKHDMESSPTNRGNEEYFGKFSKNPVPIHHGHLYLSSMPFSQQGKWLLDAGKYYENYGIRIFEIWNKVVEMQEELLYITNKKEFADHWNEIKRIRDKIPPLIYTDPETKHTSFFILSNAFDNWKITGFDYLKRECERLKSAPLIFNIEMMNKIPDTVEDCYYKIDPDRHIYYNSYNDDFIRGKVENSNCNMDYLSEIDSENDIDCNKNKPLELIFDWGSSASFLIICQDQSFDFINHSFRPTFNAIKEFFVNWEKGRVAIDDVIDRFNNYYSTQQNKQLYYNKDKYGDIYHPNTGSTYNQQAIDRLISKGWQIITQEHRGIEPPHHDKYLLWARILAETDPTYPLIRFNGNNCPYLLISMNNTRVVEKNGKFEKDKGSEKKDSGIAPEEATHFGDAMDKIVWIKYGDRLKPNSTFVPIRSSSRT